MPISMPSMPGHRASKSIGKQGGVYGIVSYDFVAERPDELDAKEGEAIIVIAQSNPEWFVAKPITRLGGPGLIPVSFIEIRDMTTGKPWTIHWPLYERPASHE
jgi:bud emergence protein 1